VCLGYNNFGEDEVDDDERGCESLGGCIVYYWDELTDLHINSSLLKA